MRKTSLEAGYRQKGEESKIILAVTFKIELGNKI